MKSTYRVLAYAIALAVVVQAASVAFGWFSVLADLESGAVIDDNYEGNAGHIAHGMVGVMVMPALALLLLLISFFAKVPGGVKWAAVVFGVTALQVVLAFVGFGVPAVGALHGVNALVLMAVAGMAGRKAASRASADAPTAVAVPNVAGSPDAATPVKAPIAGAPPAATPTNSATPVQRNP